METTGPIDESLAAGIAVVVDTCVASFLFKGSPRAAAYEQYLTGKLPILCFMSVAELELWAVSHNWGQRRQASLEQEIGRYLIYPATRRLCRSWAIVTDSARRKGFTVLSADAWIAAVAVLHSITLVTNNAGHYRGIDGLQVVSAG